MIKDSGNRTEFKSGAVRDIQEGKGRCDLLPLDIIDLWCDDGLQCTLYYVGEYSKRKGTTDYFELVLNEFAAEHQAKRFVSGESVHNKLYPLEEYRWNLVLELAKHFEEGAKKYGDRNWEKGIPCDRYIDSAVRHYCKWRAGWDDEPHDRAFIWNIVCCEWTRQQYGWNLERLKKDEGESESKKFVQIGEQLAKGVQASIESMNRLAAALSESPLTIHVKKEDIQNEDILRQIKEQEISDLKTACDVAKRYNACRNEPTDVCCTKSCMDCEHNVESEDVAKALNQLADYFKKSLENTEAE